MQFIRTYGVSTCIIAVYQVTEHQARVDIEYPSMTTTPVNIRFVKGKEPWFTGEVWFFSTLRTILQREYKYTTHGLSKDAFYLTGWC